MKKRIAVLGGPVIDPKRADQLRAFALGSLGERQSTPLLGGEWPCEHRVAVRDVSQHARNKLSRVALCAVLVGERPRLSKPVKRGGPLSHGVRWRLLVCRFEPPPALSAVDHQRESGREFALVRWRGASECGAPEPGSRTSPRIAPS